MEVNTLFSMFPLHFILAAGIVGPALATLLLLSPYPNGEHMFWKQQQWVGLKKQILARARATLRSISQTQALISQGYSKFSKANLPFAIYSMASGPVIVVPPAQLKAVMNQHESLIDVHNPQNETLQAYYTVRDPDVYINDFHFNVVRNQLTRNLARFSEEIAEELALSFERYWGSSSDWTDVFAWQSLFTIVARSANRVYVGKELCRNEEFLENSRLYAVSVFGAATVINLCPEFSRPVLARLLTLFGRRPLAICKRICKPIIEYRLEMALRAKSETAFSWDAPDDGLQWIIQECVKTEDPKQLDPNKITHRLLMLNLVSIHTTSFTLTNVILDLYSSTPFEKYVEGIREECDCVFAEANGIWTRAAVSRLLRVDSAIKESMRLSGFGILGLPRRVASPHGIELDGNIRVPRGVRLAVPMLSIHTDESLYPKATTFDAFRFSRPREAYLAEQKTDGRGSGSSSIIILSDGERVTVPENLGHGAIAPVSNGHEEADQSASARRILSLKQQSVVSLDDGFLTFGHSRHACPGRFFAAHEMKLMIAHIVRHYDIQRIPERPQSKTLVEVKLPDGWLKLKIRKKSGSCYGED